eukprot:1735095-Amphidinium_carterae.1
MMTKEQSEPSEAEQYDQWKDYNEETEKYYEEYNDEDVKYMVAMLNKGKGKNEGKGKDKGGKDKRVTCYTCGQQGHISPNCPMKKGGKGNKGKRGSYNGQWYDGKGYGQPQSQGQRQERILQWSMV